MELLSEAYEKQLDTIAESIQSSALLKIYLDEEEDDQYRALVDKFEPDIDSLYKEVANHHPLQLESFEKKLLSDSFEGLYTPKIIGYAVLRGALNAEYKYIHPQEHFKQILIAMTGSSNFDQIRLRTGQSIAAGFAASSDIWITNFINNIQNNSIKEYFEGLKSWEFRDVAIRRRTFLKFQKQFEGAIYQSSDFPENSRELKILYPQIRKLLLSRINKDVDNNTIVNIMVDTLSIRELHGQNEFLPLLGLFANFYDSSDRKKDLAREFNFARANQAQFSDKYFEYLKNTYESGLPLSQACDSRIADLLDKSNDDGLLKYYSLLSAAQNNGLLDENTLEKTRTFYNENPGLSDINECLRLSVLKKFDLSLASLSEDEYQEYIELNKIFSIYIHLFSNQEFNQQIRKSSLKYIRRLLRRFTDKRGKDYQDIKKFIQSTFLDYGFMNLKELKELFKTKRKKKEVVS